MNKNVLVIGSGNHHNTLGVVRALGEIGFDVELIATGNTKKHYVTSSRYVKTFQALEDINEIANYLYPYSQEQH